MEFVASVLGSVVAEACRHLCGFPCSKFSNPFKFKSNVNDLEKEIQHLTDLRSEVENEFNFESVSTTRVIEWLTAVGGVESKVSSTTTDLSANKEKCYGGFVNCCLRGGEVAKALKEVRRLQADGNSIANMVAAHGQSRAVEHIPAQSIEDQPTASQNLAKILHLLEDGVGSIGVWGMGGVGKTTLVKNLNNKLGNSSSTPPFGMVIWVTVSKQLDLMRIQTRIAERLSMGVDKNDSTENVAIKLHRRLKQQNKFLLILDDVWEGIDLDALGVPRPEVHPGCKIILTTRFRDVCREMKTDVEFKMNVLNDAEAWYLFCKSAGKVATLRHIKPLAKAVAKECGGLPLEIIIMGTSMRGKTKVELWNNSLNQLQSSLPYSIKGIEAKVYRPLKWSYDSLQGKDIKHCFLYCALFPEDFSIEISELVQCWWAEGLIDNQKNYDDIHNTGIALVESLKDCCLLEDGDFKDTVKMHDVVRDVALWIASSLEDECKSLVRSGVSLSHISPVELSGPLKRVSFMLNSLKSLPNCVMQCSEVSTLLLQDNPLLRRVPEDFFVGFLALKVLNMSGTHIRRLPLSLLQLGQLHSLLLRDCIYLEELPPLGSLNRLQVLDCNGTGIKELPNEMEQLSNLRVLNLSRTDYLKTIQAGVVSELSGLEILDMTHSNYKWGVKEGQASLEELGCLEQLIFCSIGLDRNTCTASEELVWITKLKRFQFLMGSTDSMIDKRTKYKERVVIFSDLDLSGERIGGWLTHVDALDLDSCWGLNGMLETLVTNSVGCFSCLKKLTISHSYSSFKPAEGHGAQYDLLPNLEEIHLHFLKHLHSISELVDHLGLRFSKLRVMEVTRCPYLDHLLDCGGVILTLENLEDLKVSSCPEVVELFKCSSLSNSVADPIVPGLQRIKLTDLPKLKSLSRQRGTWPRLAYVEVIGCDSLKKLPLSKRSADALKEIVGELEWWNRLEWDRIDIQSKLQPFFKEQRPY